MTAPAPIKSSTAGRRLPSSLQRSPAGMTAIFIPRCMVAFVTARQFLRHPANVGVSPVLRVKVDPFGEGKTSRTRFGMLVRDAGEREYVLFPLGPASTALTDFAKSAPESSLNR